MRKNDFDPCTTRNMFGLFKKGTPLWRPFLGRPIISNVGRGGYSLADLADLNRELTAEFPAFSGFTEKPKSIDLVGEIYGIEVELYPLNAIGADGFNIDRLRGDAWVKLQHHRDRFYRYLDDLCGDDL